MRDLKFINKKYQRSIEYNSLFSDSKNPFNINSKDNYISPIFKLGKNAFAYIFTFLDPNESLLWFRVSKQFYRMLKSEYLWK